MNFLLSVNFIGCLGKINTFLFIQYFLESAVVYVIFINALYVPCILKLLKQRGGMLNVILCDTEKARAVHYLVELCSFFFKFSPSFLT